MDESSRFAVGIDVGTENVRAVVLSASKTGEINVVGFNEGKATGMRKGVVANLAGPAGSIDKVLGEVERMCGRDINAAYISINGSQITSARTEGMIAVSATEHEIDYNDLARVEEIAVSGRIPANLSVLDMVPLEYAIDGQGGIKNPVGMSGTRLEMRACVVSALAPNVENLKKTAMTADVNPERVVPSVVAAARAVLTEKQMENGVAVIDLGAATTSVAVFEEGDLQYVGVVPAGSNNITNDLAIVLEIETELAEEVKTRFVTGDFDSEKAAVIKIGKDKDEKIFDRKEVDTVARERLEDIFGEVRKKLKAARYDQRLPEGVVLVGGGARMRDIEVFAKKVLETSAKVGMPKNFGGVSAEIEKPEYAAAVGLALLSIDDGNNVSEKIKPAKKKKEGKNGLSFIKKIFAKF